jgi:hypothetical protein
MLFGLAATGRYNRCTWLCELAWLQPSLAGLPDISHFPGGFISLSPLLWHHWLVCASASAAAQRLWFGVVQLMLSAHGAGQH